MLRILMALCLLLAVAGLYDLVGTEVAADNSGVGTTNNDFIGDCSPSANKSCTKTERVFYRGRWYTRCIDCETHGVGPDGLPLVKSKCACPTCPQQRGTYATGTYSTSYRSGGRIFQGRFRGKIFNGRIKAFVQKVRERFSGGGCPSCG